MRVLTAALIMSIGVVGVAAAQEPALRVVNDRESSELVFELGPLSIPAGGHGLRQPKTQAVELPVDGYLHGYTVEMVDGEGRPLPSVLLHHLNIIAPERRELFSQIMQRVGAAGAETEPLSLPRFLGYPVSKGDSLVFVAMIHNPTEESYDTVHVRVRMKHSGGGSLLPRLVIQPFYLDVMPPAGGHTYTLQPGQSIKSWEGKPAVPGRVLGVGGHMHKFGTALRFENVTTGKVLWEAKPVVDSAGNVAAMPRKFFYRRLGLQLNPAHTYRLTAEYFNPTNETIEEAAMGTLGGIFVPDDRVQWPAIDRTHAEYLTDLEATYARNSAGAAQQHHRH